MTLFVSSAAGLALVVSALAIGPANVAGQSQANGLKIVVIAGEDAGSKLDKARQLGTPILTEDQFRAIIT